ncbi:MAG TPA: D-2-hydroxyacid dehydrogenase [Gemmatimonas sp.]|uniref:D-2-hydroxyacid dehydrogenase n=1 Tax=Gemmatimonas sp. TaxID=1962908 RepID=UPI002ED960E9
MPGTFSLPFAPRHVLVSGQEHVAISDAIRAARPDLDIRNRAPADVTGEDLDWAECYVGFRPPRRADAMGQVRWVHSTGAGVDAWLNDPPLDASVLLTRSAESFGPMIAEWTVARVFAIQQQLPSLAAAQQQREWAPRDIAQVAGTRALLLGTGDIGRAIATSLRALGCTVTGVSRSGTSDHAAFHAVHTTESLPSLVADADWIICSVPDTPSTRGLISRDVLSRCRGAALLNAGRGAVIEESALPEALERGWLRAAALDVFVREPLPTDSPLWNDPRVIVSPHISGLTTTAGAVAGFIECADALARGEMPKWVVDRQRGY